MSLSLNIIFILYSLLFSCITAAQKGSGSGTTYIVVGALGGALCFAVIIIVVMLVNRRRRRLPPDPAYDLPMRGTATMTFSNPAYDIVGPRKGVDEDILYEEIPEDFVGKSTAQQSGGMVASSSYMENFDETYWNVVQ